MYISLALLPFPSLFRRLTIPFFLPLTLLFPHLLLFRPFAPHLLALSQISYVLTSITTCRTTTKGRTPQPQGFRYRGKHLFEERDQRINEIQFLRRYPQNYTFPLELKLLHRREEILGQQSRSVASNTLFAERICTHTCS